VCEFSPSLAHNVPCELCEFDALGASESCFMVNHDNE
jgi:hypothetical protein